MPRGKTSPVLWFSSMITRILLTPPPAVAAGDGEPPGAEADAGGPDGAAPVPQPAARQLTSPAPISRATLRTAPR